MPTDVLPFVNDLKSGLEELAGASPQALNVCVDGAGAVRRRPGIVDYFTDAFAASAVPTAPLALHVTEGGQTYGLFPHTVGGSVFDVYRLSPAGTVFAGQVAGSARPTITETEMLLVIAAGQQPYKLELADLLYLAQPLGGDPPKASHIIHNSLSLLANDVEVDRTKVRYSGIAAGTTTYAGHEDWSIGVGTGGFFTAAASPDPIVALGETVNEIWVFGSRTLQLFSPDSSGAFVPSSTMESGCSAPYSVVKRDDQFCWLDHARRFVRSSGRGQEVLSTTIHAALQALSRVDDCYGYRVLVGPLDCLVWTFPEAGTTFVLQDGAGWSQWAGISNETNRQTLLPITCHTYDRATGLNLVGRTEGGVGILRMGLATDGGDNPILAQVTSGFLNRGTDRRKQCNGVRLTFRRGNTTTHRPEIRGYLTWRDSPGAWEPPIPVVLDGAQPVCELRSLGTYRRRQWRYTFSDSTEDLVLAGAEEDFTVTD